MKTASGELINVHTTSSIRSRHSGVNRAVGRIALASGQFLLLADHRRLGIQVIRPRHVPFGLADRGGPRGRRVDASTREPDAQILGIPSPFLVRRPAREQPQVNPVDQRFDGDVVERQLRDSMVVAQTRQPDAGHSVGEDRGLQRVGRRLAMTRRILPGAAPAERLQYVDDGLDAWQRETRAIAFVGGRGEHPRATRNAQ